MRSVETLVRPSTEGEEGQFLRITETLDRQDYIPGPDFEAFAELVDEMVAQRVVAAVNPPRILVEGVFYTEDTMRFNTVTIPAVTSKRRADIFRHIRDALRDFDPQRFGSKDAESGEWAVIRVYFLENPSAGGCLTSSHHYKKHFVLDPATKLAAYSFPSKDNNCFFACLVRGLERSSYTNVRAVARDVRQFLKIPSGVKIHLEHVQSIADMFHMEIRVIARNCELLKQSVPSREKKLVLLLDAGHYYLVQSGEGVARGYEGLAEQICARCGTHYKLFHTCSSVCMEYFQRSVQAGRDIEANRKVLDHQLMKSSGGKKKESVGPDSFKEGIYVLDFETFFDATEGYEAQPYACGSWCAENGYREFRGRECVSQVLDDILHTASVRTIVTFNGSGFDYFPLVVECMKRGLEMEITPQGSKILNFKIRLGEREVGTFDLYLFLMSSLAKVCKDFRIAQEDAKDMFPHAFITSWESLDYVGDLPAAEFWKEKWEDVCARFPSGQIHILELSKEYLRKDIMSTLKAYEKTGELIYDRFQENIKNYLTLPHFAFEMWKQSCRYPLYVPNNDAYMYVSQALYAGRCYPRRTGYVSSQYEFVKGEKERVEKSAWSEEEKKTFFSRLYDTISDYTVDLDVVSLYPHAMTFNYPYGTPKWLNDAELHELNNRRDGKGCVNSTYLLRVWDIENTPNSGLHGIFDVEFLPNVYCTEAILPRRKKEGGLEWSLDGGRGIYTSLDLHTALLAGYRIVSINSGIVYEKVGCVLKDFIEKSYGMKAQGEESGNGVLRAMGKLLMNSVYGKFGQRPIYEVYEVCNTVDQVQNFVASYEWKGVMKIPDTHSVVLTGEVVGLDEKSKCVTKPTHIGCFILSHSRRIMYDIMKTADPFMNTCNYAASMIHMPLYGDTDSLHYHACQLPLMEPLLGKNLGQLTNDLGGGAKILRSVFVSPKLYVAEYFTAKGEMKFHMRAKGIPSSKVTPHMFDLLHGEMVNRREAKSTFSSAIEELRSVMVEDGEEEDKDAIAALEKKVKEVCLGDYGVGVEFQYWRRSGMKSRPIIIPQTQEREIMNAMRVRMCLQTRTVGRSVWEGREILTTDNMKRVPYGYNVYYDWMRAQTSPYYFTLPRGHIFFMFLATLDTQYL